LPLRNRSLRSQAAEDKLAGSIQPMPRQRVDDLVPDTLL
jgi:hypothetical protein